MQLPAQRSLPDRYRGRDGLTTMVADIPLRCAVTGVDGTFELTRMVHEALAARRRRVFAQAGLDGDEAGAAPATARARRRQDARLLQQVRQAWPVDALVVESPAVGEDGRRFNEAVQAQTVLLPGIARHPAHGGVDPDPARAEAVAASLPPRATLISGEADPRLKEALRDAVRARDAFFLDAAPRGKGPDAPPGLERITVLDRFLRIRTGGGLGAAERVRLLSRLERRLQWTPSAWPGVRWHDGTALAPAALRATLDHLLRRWPARIHLVAYFGDGKGRDADRLVPALDRAFSDGVLAHAYVAGPGSRPLVRRLSSVHPVSVFGPRMSSLPTMLRVLRGDCHSGAIVTAGDAGAPWMRAAADRLRRPGLPRGHWAPFGATAADLPVVIGVPPVGPPVPAPAFGRRSKANILGDVDPALLPPTPRDRLSQTGWQAPAPVAGPAPVPVPVQA